MADELEVVLPFAIGGREGDALGEGGGGVDLVLAREGFGEVEVYLGGTEGEAAGLGEVFGERRFQPSAGAGGGEDEVRFDLAAKGGEQRGKRVAACIGHLLVGVNG